MPGIAGLQLMEKQPVNNPPRRTPRRNFLKSAAGLGTIAAVGSKAAISLPVSEAPQGSADRIGIATVGLGQQGMRDTRSALQLPGIELVGIADLYAGRRQRAREVFGSSIVATNDYRELIERGDVDAIIVGTSDHWHTRISEDAMRAGKDVYCEKPMVQQVSEGQLLVDAQQETGRILQVGSQRTSSPTSQKARELVAAGAIGEINRIEAWYRRSTTNGAWQYVIPPDASPQTVDWDRFLGHAPRRGFDADRFFRWRSYWDYGTGIPGDLFVHLLTGIHFIAGSLGPTRVFGSGGVRYWKDGREVPDVITGVCEYPATDTHPAFNVVLGVNFADHEDGSGLRFVGSEGVLDVGRQLRLTRKPRSRDIRPSIGTFPRDLQDRLLAEHLEKYPADREFSSETIEVFSAPPGIDGTTLHMETFFDCVRSRRPTLQDAVFGFRAAGPALAVNLSYLEERVVDWDPVAMRVAG